MALRLSSRDVSGFKFLFFLATIFSLISVLVYSAIHMKFIKPLEIDAPLDRFSEARAIQHVAVLTKDDRQEGRPGLRKAAVYIKEQLEMLKERAESNIRIEVEEAAVNGTFNMIVLGHSMSFAYRNHINIVARISSADSQETDPSVLINGHFDSPLGSPGAGDCGSCVASMLELARVTAESGWIPPRPIIFLFNGAEELFMLGAHGFMKTHRWRDSIGASINVEASGTSGPDLVCQSGPGSWPSQVYAESAVYPMAHSAVQDVFHAIPGDTDYRIFSHDHGNIPSLDIIFLLGGYYYHTSYDTLDKLPPGIMQARGDNLFSILKAFTNSSKLQSAREREYLEASINDYKDERAVFFDFLSWFIIFYSRRVALVLHSIPTVIFLVMPFLLHFWDSRSRSCFATFYDFVKGMLFHAAGIILAIIFPVIFATVRLFFTSYAMSWFARPYLAFLMFVPSSIVGLLIPRTVWGCPPPSQDVSVINKSEALSEEARFWGAFGFYACITSAYLVAGLGGGFLTFVVLASMLPAWIFFSLSVKSYDHHQSPRPAVFYVIPLIPCLTYSAYFSGFVIQFLIEKMGMIGFLPPPYGYYVADVFVAATIGVATGLCVGPIIPVCSHWLARSSILQLLLHVSVLALALSSQFFPYSNLAPKRVVFQHTLVTTDANRIVNSSYGFSVLDSNSLTFLFKYAPEVAKGLHMGQELSLETADMSPRETWLGIFPVSLLFSQSLKFPARSDGVFKQYRYFPYLSTYKPHTISNDRSRRVYLEFSLGDLEEVWVAVLNITGPLSSWSFADNKLPDPETVEGGPPSYILRLSGSSQANWTFWLEASSSDDLRVEVAVVDQVLDDEAQRLKGLFPDWADVTAYSSFMSSYIF
ncbi:PREDICTED: endoplasmic reticulum metallopeptidase 1-like isoform X1 [Populus euphratica]|uniref:Endoplasmic reticulum metallopeptidase 1-like isoform X1 n=2 Tax=Populus euphratica TaxID=75702 RepID=A0AAJ6V461_POPEU|nr:PREDICTED: endoplasmic reticulum metallopeptidase 1-like isoform X1 [Populus euphratica]